MMARGNCGGVSSDARTRDQWTTGNYCAWVEAGATREERAKRLAQVPEAWREAVDAHVRCAFAVKVQASKNREIKR